MARTQMLLREIDAALPDRPFRLELWDGSTLPPTNGGGPTFRARSAAAVAHAVRAPGQLGLGRAYVSGALEVDDLDAVLKLFDEWHPAPLGTKDKARLLGAALLAAGPTLPPRAPAVELKPKGRRHSIERDRRSVRHHYDVSNDYFKLFLDESLTYSCGIFSRGATTLEEAQRTKLELVADKLAISAGDRVLDVGCGWGSFTRLAASRGAQVTGITLSEPQAALARERARHEGLAERIDIRVMDWRELRGQTFDKIASIGMVEHVGNANIDGYALRLRQLLAPGGRVLNHGIARLRHGDPEAGPFSERFVFPDAAPLHVSRIVEAFERAGLPVDHVEGFASDYAETLRHWARRFDANLEEAVRLGGPERVRVWRLYLRAARRGFESGFTSVYQVRATPN
jgi:cyclopropane-fatty-acyl-phospholipid synthase